MWTKRLYSCVIGKLKWKVSPIYLKFLKIFCFYFMSFGSSIQKLSVVSTDSSSGTRSLYSLCPYVVLSSNFFTEFDEFYSSVETYLPLMVYYLYRLDNQMIDRIVIGGFIAFNRNLLPFSL